MKQVLIVDDEADVLWMLQKNLNKGMPDVETLVAASGEKALAVLAGHPIDLVITDINMPGMNGLDLLVEINNKYPHVGVIIITAYPSNTYQSQAILAGSLKFIEKPFDIKYLRRIVEEFFNNRKSGFQGTISGIDLIDIVQFNGLSRATAALKVTNDSDTGMIFFKDGQVVHAICDQMQGEKAFFTILGFHGGNLKNIKGVDAPLVTISKSLELLLLEATSIDDEVMEKKEEKEEPVLIYEELEREPPPAFLSPREEEEKPILSEEFQHQRAEFAGKTPVLPETKIPGIDVDDEEFGESVLADPDSPAFLSDADADQLPATPLDPPDEPSLPVVVSRPPERHQNPSAERTAAKIAKTAKSPASEFLPLDNVLTEFTAIDGVRLACLVGRDGFLLASQPEGNNAYTEALGAIAASGLASTESMGQELAESGLQTGLFEYQDSMIMLSPVGEDSFLMLVAEDDANLGWLRLVMRKNTSRIQEINTSY
jgi:CheY-like chemotaxis protein/predicted regulator of Ras-like GTPase activity (Roadblock/LC7/MglB family)